MFTKSKEQQRERWYQVAKQGKTRFIWFRGVLSWGLPMFILMTLLFPLLLDSTDVGYSWSRILFGAIIWSVGGYAFGWVMWRAGVKRFGLSPDEQADSKSTAD